MSAVIRPAGVADAPWLAELAERTFRETYTTYNTPENMERYVAEHFAPALQAAELADPRYITLVAEAQGRPAGYTQLGHGPAPECVTGLDSGPAPMTGTARTTAPARPSGPTRGARAVVDLVGGTFS